MYKGGRGLTWRIMIAVLTEWRDYTIRGNVNGLSSDLSWHFPYFFNDLNDYWWYLGSLESSSCGFKFQATLMSKQASCNITTLICLSFMGFCGYGKLGLAQIITSPIKKRGRAYVLMWPRLILKIILKDRNCALFLFQSNSVTQQLFSSVFLLACHSSQMFFYFLKQNIPFIL